MDLKFWDSNKKIKDLNKQIINLESEIAEIRPALGFLSIDQPHNLRIPYFPQKYIYLYHIAHHSDVFKIILISLRREIFRRGFEKEQKFVVKCINPDCEEEYNSDIVICEKCGSYTREPSIEEEKRIDSFLENSNKNKQDLKEVFGQFEDDLNIMDDGYLLLNKDYTVSNGEIISSRLVETIRINPLYTKFIIGPDGLPGITEEGKKARVCPLHRNRLFNEDGICPECKNKLYPAYFVFESLTGDKKYYMEGEIIHASKYAPSITHGFPPILSAWQKVITLMNQDKYILDYYGMQRPPKGMLLINTRNQPALEKAWNWLLEKAKSSPHIVWPLGVETNSSRGQVGQFINFMNNLAEMQYIEGRNEIRRQIGALYGVSPIFQNDISTSGGLNNEGLQVTVTNRAVETGQAIYNKILKEIMKSMNVEDWILKLAPSEERDEMADLQREQTRIANAQAMLNMGFDIVLKDTGDFEYSGEAKKLPEPQFGNIPFDQSAAESMTGAPRIFAKSYEEEIAKGRLPVPVKEREILEEELGEEIRQSMDDLLRSIRFKNKNRKEIADKIKKLANKFTSNVHGSTKKQIKDIYLKAVENVEKELNQNFMFGKPDSNAIEALQNSKVFSDAFKGVDSDMTKRINETIAEAFKNPKTLTIPKLVKQLKEEVNLSESRLNMIVRTETTKISNSARLVSYSKADEDNNFVYKWIGPDDYRTTSVCKSIKKRTNNGVSKDELINIIKEESSKEFNDWDVNPEAPCAHYGCRHVLVRVVK